MTLNHKRFCHGDSSKATRIRRAALCASLWMLCMPCLPTVAHAEEFTISTGFGSSFTVDVPHVDPGGSLVSPLPASSPDFRPPSIFSAPLPAGSGARALGLSGAFTAVADDATAASWNPGGLIQLERPEGSFVLRASQERQRHRSNSDDLEVGDDTFDSMGLNYLSLVLPFRAMDRNFVFSANYQEAYDFEQRFTATFKDRSSRKTQDTSSDTFSRVVKDSFDDGIVSIDITSDLTTDVDSRIDQVLSSDLLTDLEFDQEGVIEAFTPALAAQLHPKLSAGIALNYYQDSSIGNGIRSTTHATYSGKTLSRSSITDVRTTSGSYVFSGTATFPGTGTMLTIPATSGTYPSFSDTDTRRASEIVEVEGELTEINEFSDLHGYNATIGALWTVNRHISVGASVDLPWTAEAEQRKIVRNRLTVFNEGRTRIKEEQDTEETTVKDVEFDFPLFWNVGIVVRANNRLYISLDAGQTLWSDFSFKAEGEQRINPLDGSPHGQNEIDDTWRIAGGLEYLLVFETTEIPLRGGVSWEQRPAIGTPDEFWNFSLGTGISIGKGEKKVIIDFAYILTIADDVLGSLVPEQDLTTDVVEHQGFVSCIKHF